MHRRYMGILRKRCFLGVFMINTAKLLGYAKDDLTTKNTTELYQDIGIDIEKMLELTFNSTIEDRMLTGL